MKSIKKGFAPGGEERRLSDVTTHVLPHTAAVHMTAAGVPMTKISQYLGHSNTSITERIYARYSPDHLQDAAKALDFGNMAEVQ